METLSSAEEAYLRIRSLLLSGDAPPGTPLSERQLSERLGMSRTPIREALKHLQRDGLVTVGGRGLGVIVAGLSAAEVTDAYRYRAALEALTAELAAERSRDGELSRAQLAELESRAEAVEVASGRDDARRASVANLRFHQWICTLAANTFATESLTRLWDRIEVSSLSNLTVDASWRQEVHRDHRELLEGIAGGDPVRAAEAARRHIHRAAEVYSGTHAHHEEQR